MSRLPSTPHIHAHHPTWPAGKGLTHPDAEVRLHPVMMLRLQGHSSGVTGVAFSPDGAMIASSSEDNSVRVWELASGECRATLQVRVRIYRTLQQCKYLHVFGDDALPSTAAHCAHPVRGAWPATCAHGASVSTSGVPGAEAVGCTCWMHPHTHTPIWAACATSSS